MVSRIGYPHLFVILDIGWMGIRCGLGYYDVNSDAFRPAFIDVIWMSKWRCTFEAGKITKIT